MAGAAYCRAIRQAQPTSTGNQDFTIAGFGTPKAAIVIIQDATTDGTVGVNARWSYGFTDGTRSRTLTSASTDNLADSDCARAAVNDKLVAMAKADASGFDILATFDSFITDGIRINWGTVDVTARLVTVILFGGADCSAHVNDFDIPAGSVNDTLNITSPGFQPTMAFFITGTVAFSASSTNPTAAIALSLGMAANTGSAVERAGVAMAMADTAATSNPTLKPTTGGVAAQIRAAATTPFTTDWAVDVSAWLSTGFTAKQIVGADSGPCAYLAVRMGNALATCVTVNSPTTIGNTATVTPGFQPGQVFILGTVADAVADKADAQAGIMSFGFSSRSEEFCFGQCEVDNAATMDNATISDNVALNVLANATTQGLVAAGTYSDTVFTLTFSAVGASARKQFVMVVERAVFSAAVTATMSPMSAAAAGEEDFIGTVAASMSPMSAAVVAQEQFIATSAATMSPMGAAAVAELQFVATTTATMSPMSAAAVGLEVFSAVVTATLGSLQAATVGEVDYLATVAATLGSFMASVAAEQDFIGSVAGTFGPVTASASAQLAFESTVVATLSPMSSAAVGQLVFTSTVGVTFSPLSGSAIGQLVFTATVGATLGPIAAEAAGDLSAFSGTVNATLGAMSGAASAQLVFTAAVAGTFAPASSVVLGQLVFVASVTATLGVITAHATDSKQLGGIALLLGSMDEEAEMTGSRDDSVSLTGSSS